MHLNIGVYSGGSVHCGQTYEDCCPLADDNCCCNIAKIELAVASLNYYSLDLSPILHRHNAHGYKLISIKEFSIVENKTGGVTFPTVALTAPIVFSATNELVVLNQFTIKESKIDNNLLRLKIETLPNATVSSLAAYKVNVRAEFSNDCGLPIELTDCALLRIKKC